MIWTGTFWKAAAERAISTAAQTFVAIAGAGAFNIIEADWTAMLSVSAGAGLLAVLKGLAASQVGDGGPGFTSAEELTDADMGPLTQQKEARNV